MVARTHAAMRVKCHMYAASARARRPPFCRRRPGEREDSPSVVTKACPEEGHITATPHEEDITPTMSAAAKQTVC